MTEKLCILYIMVPILARYLHFEDVKGATPLYSWYYVWKSMSIITSHIPSSPLLALQSPCARCDKANDNDSFGMLHPPPRCH